MKSKVDEWVDKRVTNSMQELFMNVLSIALDVVE